MLRLLAVLAARTDRHVSAIFMMLMANGLFVSNTLAAADTKAPVLAGSAEHVSYGATDADAAPPTMNVATGADEISGPIAGGGSSGALIINATFDSSITTNANAAAIEAMINDAVAVYQSLFNDPITINILFRYATTSADGNPLPGNALAVSRDPIYAIQWNTYVSSLIADATTPNDATANASLPGGPLSTNLNPSAANGRALGLNTPPAMFADGSVGLGGPYDGIVTLNSNQTFDFTRPPVTGFDALRATEHEIDEVMGFGSNINFFSDYRPQDVFSWSSPGTRSISTSGSRYFSIDGGTTDIVEFNQDPGGDFGDWAFVYCPAPMPLVQDAFSCPFDAADVTTTSPEGVNLDVIGYDLIVGPTPTPTLTPSATAVTPTPTLTPSPTSTPTLTEAPSPTPTAKPIDHFTCYKAAQTSGFPKFAGIPNPPGLGLIDRFGGSLDVVKQPKLLCAPASENGGDPTAPTHTEHLEAYQLKGSPRGSLVIVDEFNPTGIFLALIKPAYVMVPTAKSLSGPPPTPAMFVTDDFQCYQVKPIYGPHQPKFAGVSDVALQDQFGSMTVDVQKPKHLCTPVDTNGDDPSAPTHVTQLMCYQVKQTDAAKFAAVTTISTNNQFGAGTLDAKKPAELCVPARPGP